MLRYVRFHNICGGYIVILQAFCDLIPIYTGDGRYEIFSLITGWDVTGIASFKHAATPWNMKG